MWYDQIHLANLLKYSANFILFMIWPFKFQQIFYRWTALDNDVMSVVMEAFDKSAKLGSIDVARLVQVYLFGYGFYFV